MGAGILLKLPKGGTYQEIAEPICKVDIICPKDQIGDIMKLCLDRRGLTYGMFGHVDAGVLHSKNKLTERVNDGFPVLTKS